jgi:radical SAM superfamily enzyme YgiQ (UPF0313 family)
MKKIERENQDDNFVNVYAEGFFFRCKEHSAVLVSKLKNYRIYLNICKKNNFVFLECGFPAGNVFELKNMLKELGYNYRIYGGNRKVDEILEELT